MLSFGVAVCDCIGDGAGGNCVLSFGVAVLVYKGGGGAGGECALFFDNGFSAASGQKSLP